MVHKLEKDGGVWWARGGANRLAAAMVRHFERLCHDHFGHGPKAVLRRSRFLDMAQALRGFSAPSEEALATMRYFDQSHRNREFRHFVRMTARAFETTPTPLLTAGLKLRAEGVS